MANKEERFTRGEAARKIKMIMFPTQVALRSLEEADFFKDYLSCLGELTTVGSCKFPEFKRQLEKMRKAGVETVVLEDLQSQIIIGSASLFMEPKLIHSCGSVGHIEDVVVRQGYRGKGFGKILIEYLIYRAQGHPQPPYKLILDCAEEKQAVYQKYGFHQSGLQMRKDL